MPECGSGWRDSSVRLRLLMPLSLIRSLGISGKKPLSQRSTCSWLLRVWCAPCIFAVEATINVGYYEPDGDFTLLKKRSRTVFVTADQKNSSRQQCFPARDRGAKGQCSLMRNKKRSAKHPWCSHVAHGKTMLCRPFEPASLCLRTVRLSLPGRLTARKSEDTDSTCLSTKKLRNRSRKKKPLAKARPSDSPVPPAAQTWSSTRRQAA